MYYWALVAPEPLQSEITQLKQEAAVRFHSRKALRSPAHITLLPPLWLTPMEVGSLHEDFCEAARQVPGFRLLLQGAGGFPRRVVFLHVQSNEILTRLVVHMREIHHHHFPGHKTNAREFHPHVTLAFRDLAPELYDKAMLYFRAMDLAWTWDATRLERLVLKEDGWHVDARCPFGGSVRQGDK